MALASWVPQVIQRRQALSLAAAEYQRPPQTRVVRAAGTVRGSAMNNSVATSSPRPLQLVAGGNSTGPAAEGAQISGSQRISSQRQAYLAARARGAKRRMILSAALLVGTAAMWTIGIMAILDWYWALIPSGLLVTVVAMGTIAARAGRRADRDYSANLNKLASPDKPLAQRGNHPELSVRHNAQPVSLIGGQARTPSVVSKWEMPISRSLPIAPAKPITAKIPDAEMSEIVARYLADATDAQPLEPETRWSLGTRAAHAPEAAVVADVSGPPAEAAAVGVSEARIDEQTQQAEPQAPAPHEFASDLPAPGDEPRADSGPNATVLAFPAPPDRPRTDTLSLPLDEILARRRAVS